MMYIDPSSSLDTSLIFQPCLSPPSLAPAEITHGFLTIHDREVREGLDGKGLLARHKVGAGWNYVRDYKVYQFLPDYQHHSRDEGFFGQYFKINQVEKVLWALYRDGRLAQGLPRAWIEQSAHPVS